MSKLKNKQLVYVCQFLSLRASLNDRFFFLNCFGLFWLFAMPGDLCLPYAIILLRFQPVAPNLLSYQNLTKTSKICRFFNIIWLTFLA